MRVSKEGEQNGAIIYPKGSGIRILEVANRTEYGGQRQEFGSSFMVSVPGRLTGTGRKRRQFSTLKEAKEWAEQQFSGAKQQGHEFFELTDDERHHAVEAVKLLRPHPHLTLVDTVKWALERMNPAGGDRTVESILSDLLASKEIRFKNGQLRERSIKDFRVRAQCLKESILGPRLIKEVTSQDIKKWILGLELKSRTNKNYLAFVSEVFRYAQQKRYISVNPFMDFTRDDLKEIRGNPDEHREPHILTVKQAEDLLKAALAHPELDLLAPVTLALFCGIRTEELTKLKWAHVTIDPAKPEGSFVTVPKEIAKKRRIRIVPIPSNALAWLAHDDPSRNS